MDSSSLSMDNIAPRIKSLKVPKEYKSEFIQELIDINIKREKLLSFILIAVDLILLSIDSIASNHWTRNTHVFGKFGELHIFLLVIPCIFLLLTFIGNKVSIKWVWFYRLSHLILITAVLTFCSLIAANNVIKIQSFTYVIAIFCIASLIFFKNIEINIIFIYSYLLYVFQAIKTHLDFHNLFANFFFLGMLVILALLVSNINYYSHLKCYIDRKTILNQHMELREITGLLKATFDNIPDIINVHNIDGELIHCNKAAYSYINTDNKSNINRTCYELIGKTKPCESCILKEVRNKKTPVSEERYIETINSWLDVRAYPIFDDSSNIIKIIEHIRDITVQKSLEMELQKSNSILKAQQEASLDGILITDASRQILSYNNRFLDLWNIPRNIMTVNNDKGLLHYVLPIINEDEKLISQVEEQSKESGLGQDKLQLKNGTILERYSAPIFLYGSEKYGRVWFFRDITEKEEMYEDLIKCIEENENLLKETVKYDELKSEFFANISHELRTPLNVILACIQLSEFNMKNDGKSDIYFGSWNKNIKTIKQNCFRLLRLINNLIDVTKIDAGFHELQLQPLNIINLVEEITLSVAEYAKGLGITTQFNTDVAEKIMYIDPDKMERIILNLLSNAIKFTDPKGNIFVDIQDKGDNIVISVKDTGIGINPDKQDIIFQRFRQADQALTRKCEGSGIGLSLVQSLVKMHGGEIIVKSEIGIGSEFIINLPVSQGIDDGHNQFAFAYSSNHVEKMNIEFSDIYK